MPLLQRRPELHPQPQTHKEDRMSSEEQGRLRGGNGGGVGLWARGKPVSLPGFQALPSVYRKKSLEATHHPNPEAPGKQLLPERKQVPTGFIFLLLSSVRRDHTLTPSHPHPHLTSVLAPISPPAHLVLTLCPLPPFPLHGSEVRTWLGTGRDTWSHLVPHGRKVSVDAVLLGRWAHGLASPR